MKIESGLEHTILYPIDIIPEYNLMLTVFSVMNEDTLWIFISSGADTCT